jgi:hypothetical protein
MTPVYLFTYLTHVTIKHTTGGYIVTPKYIHKTWKLPIIHEIFRREYAK